MEKWMMNDADIFDITENCFCKDPVCEKCDREIAKKSQKKLLEYLIAEKECYLHSERILYTADIRYMLKQLEEKRNV